MQIPNETLDYRYTETEIYNVLFCFLRICTLSNHLFQLVFHDRIAALI